LEAPNGIGKSTMLRMFNSNLISGNIYFGRINRSNLSFEDICSSIFHIVQASEYTPIFTQDEVKEYKGRDPWLEEQLGLSTLMEKDTIEMSGGQKKRLFIYMVLTSNAKILLLDEILSELSTEETPEVPEGGGWLNRVINTLANWNGRQHKIMILVGHGLIDLMPESIIKLKLEFDDGNTILKLRN
jgi:ABC-type cobalamin/Fe3+-siderophores transport system ATPase subunit